jgi:plastocyanin
MEGHAMRHRGGFAAILTAILGVVLVGTVPSGDVGAQLAGPTTHTIFLTVFEVKGGTTTDKLAPTAVNPAELSKSYGFKGPGDADKSAPLRWEVSSYMFNPAFVIVREGDTVALTAFVVNGDEHEIWVTGPDGNKVVANTMWQRGREYRTWFVAEMAGTYQLTCSSHAPSMAATFLVLPR